LTNAVLQAYLGDAPSRRIRRLRRLSAEERQRETEELIALYLSFPIDELLPKERPLLRLPHRPLLPLLLSPFQCSSSCFFRFIFVSFWVRFPLSFLPLIKPIYCYLFLPPADLDANIARIIAAGENGC
jgi:hypothetical protein